MTHKVPVFGVCTEYAHIDHNNAHHTFTVSPIIKTKIVLLIYFVNEIFNCKPKHFYWTQIHLPSKTGYIHIRLNANNKKK
jgi:hypothetical protein